MQFPYDLKEMAVILAGVFAFGSLLSEVRDKCTGDLLADNRSSWSLGRSGARRGTARVGWACFGNARVRARALEGVQACAAKAFVRRLSRDAYYWAFEFC